MDYACFVSGPYSNEPELNTKKAIEAADKLISMGILPLVPHLWHYHDAYFKRDYETWLKMSLMMLDRADFLLRLPGESSGADKEVSEAEKRDIPIFYSFDEIKEAIEVGIL